MTIHDVRFSRPLRLQSRSPRGAILLYIMILMVVFSALCSFAADYGHVQLVKSQLQRTADATARAYALYYMTGSSQGQAAAAAAPIYSQTNNPMDAGVSPTVTAQ